MARYRVRMKKGINIPRVVAKTTGVIIALYVGNEIINQVGSVMNCTQGPFNTGFKLIGWTVDSTSIPTTTGICNGTGLFPGRTTAVPNLLHEVGGSGVLTVVGIVGIASIIMEFVEFTM